MDELYNKIADALVEDGYIVIDDALDIDFVKRLYLKAKDIKTYKEAGISKSLHLDKKRRADKIDWLKDDGDVASLYLDFTINLMQFLNQNLYLGLRYYEAHFAKYEIGDFYEKHIDAFRGSKNRVVTTVFYLNEDYKDEDGGELVIYDENSNKLKTVLPKANTLVVFLSDKFPHEVLKAKKTRYSIAGWFRVDK